jgi:hypothetical protein
MAHGDLPFIRGRVLRADLFRSPTGGRERDIALPPRNAKQQRKRILDQLDAIADAVSTRPESQRDPTARREIIAIVPEPGFRIEPDPLSDAKGDVRLVAEDPETGVVLLDAPGPELTHLRKKLAAYADDGKVSEKSGLRRNAATLEPIREVTLARAPDVAGPVLRHEALLPHEHHWFEVTCRGGTRVPVEETTASRLQIMNQLRRLRHRVPPQEFVASEVIVFFVRLTLTEITALQQAVDCIYDIDLAEREIRDWLLLDDQPAAELRRFALRPPPSEAPEIVLLDTGIATGHPMLKSAIRAATSVVPTNNSPEDTFGHGTRMAGIALYEDVGAAVQAGQHVAPYWLQSVRLLTAPGVGSASAAHRPFWPAMTQDAVQKADASRAANRTFVLAVTAPNDSMEPTYWSHAVDQLAFNGSRGRLICVSTGNADTDVVQLLEDYPVMHLQQKIEDPAQAANALTVGAYTRRTTLPPDRDYAACKTIAPKGGISPHTRTGCIGAPGPIKPEIVLEGGNVAFDGSLPDASAPTLVALTTGKDFVRNPLTTICKTSEATAHGAHLCARVWAADDQMRAETVRGLLVHAASWTPEMRTQFPTKDELLAACGYGVPDPLLASACALNRATVIVEDRMSNAVAVERPKKKVPKRKETKPTETILRRQVKFFRLPVPDSLLDNPDEQVELRVTLSYFAEPNTFRRRVFHGLDLKWDMQGPAEREEQFVRRVNALEREPGVRDWAGSFKWHIGLQRRSRGTVQSDRWSGPASMLAGGKLIAVIPVQGWWDRRKHLQTSDMPFSLITTVETQGTAIYNEIAEAVAIGLPVEVEVSI